MSKPECLEKLQAGESTGSSCKLHTDMLCLPGCCYQPEVLTSRSRGSNRTSNKGCFDFLLLVAHVTVETQSGWWQVFLWGISDDLFLLWLLEYSLLWLPSVSQTHQGLNDVGLMLISFKFVLVFSSSLTTAPPLTGMCQDVKHCTGSWIMRTLLSCKWGGGGEKEKSVSLIKH